jgi:hypothetical protein
MKVILTTIAALSIAAGSAIAGCGKVETTEGKLKSFNAETKTVVIDVDGTEKSLKLTPSSKGADKLASLEGKKVKALSEHGKITEIGK